MFLDTFVTWSITGRGLSARPPFLDRGRVPVAMSILCRVMGHHRSRLQAVPTADGGWESRCSRCGIKMLRVRPGFWIVAERAEQQTQDAQCSPPDRSESFAASRSENDLR